MLPPERVVTIQTKSLSNYSKHCSMQLSVIVLCTSGCECRGCRPSVPG